MGFFSITDHNRKISLADKINTLIFEIINGKEAFDFKFYFSEVWRKKGGFEIIGNPPYVQIQNYSGQQIQKDWEKRNYKTFARTGDIYCLFYEKGHYLLRVGLGPSRRELAHSRPGL